MTPWQQDAVEVNSFFAETGHRQAIAAESQHFVALLF
jgi:hypothetical protein